jgi:hypothetical protein
LLDWSVVNQRILDSKNKKQDDWSIIVL